MAKLEMKRITLETWVMVACCVVAAVGLTVLTLRMVEIISK